jgi:hypothetical protein
MRYLRHFPAPILVLATSLLTGITLRTGSAVLAAAPQNPDFLTSDSALSHPIRIIAYGDMRFTNPTEILATNPKVRRWLVEQIAVEKPDALLLSGDVPWHGSQTADYDVFRRETQIWRDMHLLVYPVLGNHELSGSASEQQSLENWWTTFPELRNRRWYSVQLGSSIYVLNLDSNSPLMTGSEQLAWIRTQLASLPASIRFVFFNLHHPPIVDVQELKPGSKADSHNGRPNEQALAEYLAIAPEKSRVRFIVTAGHIHNYERFFQDDIVYVVSGGGGAGARPVVRGPADLFQDSGFPNYNYVKFVQDGEDLKATMIRVAAPDADTPTFQEKDHFEIQAVAGPQASGGPK